MFLQTIAEEEATGRIAEIYKMQKSQLGFVMEAAKCFTARPDLLPAYTDFSDKIRSRCWLMRRRSPRTHPRLLRPTSTGCDQSDSRIGKSAISHSAPHFDALSVGSSTQWAPVPRPPSSMTTRN